MKGRNSKIPKGQKENVKSEDKQDHGQQNETKDKHRTHNTTLKTKTAVTLTVQAHNYLLICSFIILILLHKQYAE